MLKWILILLKAVTIVPAVVSMKRAAGLELQKGRNDLLAAENKMIRSRMARADRLRAAAEQAYKQFRADQGYPEICVCTGCTVLRGLSHGYAERMRGAIRRYIEAESA